MATIKRLSVDQSWDLLKQICDASNKNDFVTLKALALDNLNSLQEQHFDAILYAGITLTKDFVQAEREFLTAFDARLRELNQQFDSFRTAMRWQILQDMLAEQS